MTSLAPHMEAFHREHLARHRGASQHTCDSYAYSFQSLFAFASQKLKVAPSALLLELSFRVIRRFVADRRARIDAARGNQRLSSRLRRAPSA